MKKVVAAAILCILSTQLAFAAKPDKCTTIPSGELYTSANEQIFPGYDSWGYNYQARKFNGNYCGSLRQASCPYMDVSLAMKWNDAWLSNQDCDDDGLLDRHYGHDSYIGSGAWTTNHMSGTNPDGSTWTYFVKIVAAPEEAVEDGLNWRYPNGDIIGPVIWRDFAIVQQVVNDPSTGEHGAQFISPAGPGLGKY